MNSSYEELIDQHVLVKWIDSISGHGWATLDDAEPLDSFPLIESIGFLIKESEEGILIVGDMSTLEHGRDANRPIRIPKGCIKEIIPLLSN